jgi:hypothetical protein
MEEITDSISLDSKSLLKQHPEYLQQFPQTKAGTRDFRFIRMVDKTDITDIHNSLSNNHDPIPQTGMGFFMQNLFIQI